MMDSKIRDGSSESEIRNTSFEGSNDFSNYKNIVITKGSSPRV